MAKKRAAPKSPGTTYTDEQRAALQDVICERIAAGESLRGLCRDADMPGAATVFRWLAADEVFAKQYGLAQEERAETFADEIVAIADEQHLTTKQEGQDVVIAFDSTAVQRNKLRVDARKWVASKLKPKKYGERVQHANDPDNPLPAPQFVINPVAPKAE